MNHINGKEENDNNGSRSRCERGIAILSGNNLKAYPTPDTDEKIIELISGMCSNLKPDFCVIEKVGGYVGEKQPGSAMFNFGDINGFVRGVIKTHGIPVELVTPQNWQKSPFNSTKEKRCL